jgi:hypothetical protein
MVTNSLALRSIGRPAGRQIRMHASCLRSIAWRYSTLSPPDWRAANVEQPKRVFEAFDIHASAETR